jgi:hypothetical protein
MLLFTKPQAGWQLRSAFQIFAPARQTQQLTLLVVVRIIRLDRPREIHKQTPNVFAHGLVPLPHEIQPIVKIGKGRFGGGRRGFRIDMRERRGFRSQCGWEEDLPERDCCNDRASSALVLVLADGHGRTHRYRGPTPSLPVASSSQKHAHIPF